ncbi:MAG: hypothetical protein ACE5GM_01225 [bacterium]
MFDRTSLVIKPLSDRKHGLDLSVVSRLSACSGISRSIKAFSDGLIRAEKKGAAIMLMIGAHVVRSGVQRYLIDLMERGYISCLAMNGAGVIHDFEFALIGATTESVAAYIKEGQFGLWKETGRLNEIINRAYRKEKKTGLGQAVGQAIDSGDYPHKEVSLLAAAYRQGIPVTVHVGIGSDIIHEHPNCDGAATGALSYNDFLRFVSVVENLEHGAVMNFGSAVMAPEVFLKALSMARNVARQKERVIKDFSVLVCDLHDLPEDFTAGPPDDSAAYYFRPWKTMLVRTVADGGKSFYVKGRHAETIPALWSAINNCKSEYPGIRMES